MNKPNIILCMTDDQGWGDTGYNGHRFVRTAVLDEMAASGLKFNRFYAAAADISPTILGNLGVQPGEQVQPLDGVSLRPLIEGRMRNRSKPMAI